MKKLFLFILIALTILSCKKAQQNADDLSFHNTISISNQITIKLYDSTLIKKQSRKVESFKPVKTYKAINKEQIENFRKIFENAEKTKYCCCPISSYSISFLKDDKELDIYYVDTIEYKDKVRVYEKGYQYSYIIEKQKWKNYLDKIEK